MRFLLLVGFLWLSVLCAEIPSQSRQLIVVTTHGWNDNSGVLQRYERDDKGWHTVGEKVAIKLGRNGLGWGIGLHKTPKDSPYIKHEGDGRSPAGIFELKQAFGYQPMVTAYPYEVYRSTDHCVDDVHSRYYNKIVDSTKITPDYHSMEHMKFPKNYYKYGIVVNHNHIDEPGAIAGAGSCIFLHIKQVPTAGCTVMNEAQIKEIIKWLDIEKDPLLVQGTQAGVKKMLHDYFSFSLE
jgi:D-alanyl-D-alanine dipeptidase